MSRFNTLVKYTRIPQDDDLSMNESECMLLCRDPKISYDRISQTLEIFGPEVNYSVVAKNVSILDENA